MIKILTLKYEFAKKITNDLNVYGLDKLKIRIS